MGIRAGEFLRHYRAGPSASLALPPECASSGGDENRLPPPSSSTPPFGRPWQLPGEGRQSRWPADAWDPSLCTCRRVCVPKPRPSSYLSPTPPLGKLQPTLFPCSPLWGLQAQRRSGESQPEGWMDSGPSPGAYWLTKSCPWFCWPHVRQESGRGTKGGS